MNEDLRKHLVEEFGEDIIKEFEKEVGSLKDFTDKRYKAFINAKIQKTLKRNMQEIITMLDFAGMSMDLNLGSTMTSNLTNRSWEIDLTITEKPKKKNIKPGVN